HGGGDEVHHLLGEVRVEMIGSSEDRAAGPVKADSQPKAGAMASLNRACPGLAHTRLPTSTSDSHHPFLQSNRLGENLKTYFPHVAHPIWREFPAYRSNRKTSSGTPSTARTSRLRSVNWTSQTSTAF